MDINASPSRQTQQDNLNSCDIVESCSSNFNLSRDSPVNGSVSATEVKCKQTGTVYVNREIEIISREVYSHQINPSSHTREPGENEQTHRSCLQVPEPLGGVDDVRCDELAGFVWFLRALCSS